MVAEGHEVANHSWSHVDLTTLDHDGVADQLNTTSDELASLVGHRPALMRPPYGEFNDDVLATAHALGMEPVLWDIWTGDWQRPGTETIVERVRQARAGSIVSMHDSAIVEALPEVLDVLQQKGLKFVTVSQLLSDNPPATSSPAPVPVPVPVDPGQPAPPEADPPPAFVPSPPRMAVGAVVEVGPQECVNARHRVASAAARVRRLRHRVVATRGDVRHRARRKLRSARELLHSARATVAAAC
jgi:hypothetical protein